MSEQENNTNTQPEPELTEEQIARRKLADAESALFANPPQSNPFEGEIRIGTNT